MDVTASNSEARKRVVYSTGLARADEDAHWMQMYGERTLMQAAEDMAGWLNVIAEARCEDMRLVAARALAEWKGYLKVQDLIALRDFAMTSIAEQVQADD